ncbi:AT-rich interactive domain-containing protein 4B-like isoform X2 [Zophobas morio]|uniref:AT-rich interactive domain-containing protein 4B-like isoform X2 n=1 Tax=Zophobas morio TaxID=2755281 RepID=UPI0030835F85
MQADDPPYLSVGTAVSAKYKGAFCEAKVSKVVRIVKCKVTYKMGLGTATVSDEQVKGTLRVGHTVQAKHPEKKEFVEATIGKIQDCSQYTVVFDDGDITTLRRSALCLKSGRHFNESETLDQLPLTHPEHFGNPVVGGRRGRRNRQEDSSEGEGEEENEPDLEGYSIDIGRVVSVEATDKKRGKDNWFPGLVVIPSAQPTVRINVKDEYLVRSFKDGRYYTVPKKEVSEFSRELGEKVESSVLAEAVNKALKYLDNNELPVHWERNSLFNMQSIDSDSDENYSDSSDDEPNEEKDRFVAQLYKFMDDSGTPLNKSPMIGNKDVDLHKMFRVVHKLGGYNRVTNKNKWRLITTRLKLPNNQATFNQVKNVYKKCLLSYESFYKTLGVTMLNHSISAKKNRGRSLIRDKDRSTPVNSPKPDKDDDILEKKDDEKSIPEDKSKKKMDFKREDEKRRKELVENSDTNSSDATDQSESVPSTSKDIGRPRRIDRLKEKKAKTPVGDKVKPESIKKDDEEKIQQTRSKSQTLKPKEVVNSLKKDTKAGDNALKIAPKQTTKKSDDDKKRGRKKINSDEKASVEIVTDSLSGQTISVGDKLKVYYGPTHEQKVTYEAKVLEIEKEPSGLQYLVHYTGWNTRYDEWIAPSRIAENLSANTKAKRLKQGTVSASTSSSKTSTVTKTSSAKRGRGTSVTSRITTTTSTTEPPRSTTPSSVTSSSSRTKSPATPATRSTSRMTRLDYGRKTRRASAQTDVSNHSESDSEISESEAELTRTRSGNKSEDVEIRTYKKKISRTPTVTKSEKLKDKEDADTEKEEESDRSKRTRKLKKSPEKSGEESDEDNGSNLPKGRDFDLNQIRSELKGFNKAVKVPSLEAAEKEVLSSSDDSSTPILTKIETVEEKKEIKAIETSPTSDDIYEFKEPEPFEFESRAKMVDDKASKKRIPRLYEDLEKSPKKKIIKSPGKSDKDSPELDKKRFRRTPVRKQDESEEDEKKDDEDPFDKLVESPSFNIKPLEKVVESKPKVLRSTPEEALNVFRDAVEEYTRDIDLSDNESQGQHLFTRDDELFSGTFTKYSPERNLDLDFSSKVEDIKKENDDLESIRESITRAIERTPSSDECDNLSDEDDDLVITTSTITYQGKKREADSTSVIVDANLIESTSQEDVEVKVEVKEEVIHKSPILQISPALQETDSSLLESICSQPLAISTKLEDTKDLNLKTGTRIADSLLQKLTSINNKPDSDSEQDIKKEVDKDTDIDDGIKLIDVTRMIKQVELKVKPSDMEVKKSATPTKIEPISDIKKRRKVVSRAYIEESDSNSSDSEQLVIARSDEDSQTTSLDKPDLKESDSNMSTAHIGTTDDSQSQEEQRNFKFDTTDKSLSPEPIKEEQHEPENVKEDEPDSQLHSLLLCEETIPRSPAPASEGSSVVEQKPKAKSVLEMPFASAPGNCNNKNMLLNNEHKPVTKPQPPPLVLPIANRDNRDVSTVITPPSTPGSSTSGDHGDLSPNTIENESCKSNDAELDYPRKRRNSSLNKVPLYSEDDTQMTNEPSTGKKSREECVAASCRKRRKSVRGIDEIPAKRGRKPLNRSRQNSDSDDTSEHSLTGSATNLGLPSYDRTSKSPRPSKYNFFVEFDPSLNSGQRIAVLQQKLSELRKTYAEVKAELAAVERRRKKIRRREREALKASKQEMVCG